MKKLYALCVLFLALACKKDNDETPLLSSEKNILSFTFIVEGTTYSSTISNARRYQSYLPYPHNHLL